MHNHKLIASSNDSMPCRSRRQFLKDSSYATMFCLLLGKGLLTPKRAEANMLAIAELAIALAALGVYMGGIH